MKSLMSKMTEKETILVTGAGGFIGGWIVEVLHLSHTANARAGIRTWSSAARLARFPLEIVLCDVLDKESIVRAMTGASCVIHCVSGSSEAIIQGTENMLNVALAQNVRRFVQVSTTEVYGNVDGKIDETSPCQSTGNPYGDAKLEAEKLCWGHYEKGLPVTVIRPSIVYGPFSRDWTIGFAQRLQSGNWGIFKGYGGGICNLVYVADLVSGILLAARHESAVGEAFNLVGPESITWNQYFKKFNTALGLPELRVIDPANARLRAAVMDPIRSLGKYVLKHYSAPLRKISQGNRRARGLMQYADRTLKTNPRMSELSLYNREALYLTTKARDMLGYKPRFGVDRGLELSVRWLNNVGLVERRS
jgi:nucleoside-diphosphate-sugar epimerase